MPTAGDHPDIRGPYPNYDHAKAHGCLRGLHPKVKRLEGKCLCNCYEKQQVRPKQNNITRPIGELAGRHRGEGGLAGWIMPG